MLFNSLEFAVFFTLVFGVYLVLRHRAQNLWLLAASYVFYGAWDWRFLGLIVVSTLVDYAVGLRLGATDDSRGRRRWLTLSLVSNLGILAVFKYYDFFATSLADLLARFGVDASPATLDVLLPVGISFYTFQTLSYTIDVYRRELEPTRRLPDFALFVAFFPQLVAGPIERASRLLPQVLAPRRLDWGRLGSGAWLILWGTFKKVVIADNLAALVDAVYAADAAPTGVEVLLATYAFAFQIYCDFSGYTDVARGLARCMGFELMLNFDLPYLAVNPADFWRRWHISLSTWLRDYLYIALGGNRGGTAKTYRNLALTMLLGGLWHGAAWTFVLWGAYQGALLIVHRALRPLLPAAPSGRAAAALWWALRVVVTFQFVCLGWMIFRAESVPQLLELLGVLFGDFTAGVSASWVLPFVVLVGPLLLMQAVQALARDPEVVLRAPLLVRAFVYAALIEMIVVLGEDHGQPFIYFQF